MKKHVTLVAALQIGFSTLGILAAMIIFFALTFAGSFVTDVDVASSVLKFLAGFLPMLIICFSTHRINWRNRFARLQEMGQDVGFGCSCTGLSEFSAGYPEGGLFHMGIDAG